MCYVCPTAATAAPTLRGKTRKRNDFWVFSSVSAVSGSGFLSHLHGLSSLLCISQQLDGDSPTVLYCVLEINEGVAHVTAHAALSADRHRAGFTEEEENLAKRRAKILGWCLLCRQGYTTSKQRLQAELRSDIDKHSFEIHFGSSHIETDI